MLVIHFTNILIGSRNPKIAPPKKSNNNKRNTKTGRKGKEKKGKREKGKNTNNLFCKHQQLSCRTTQFFVLEINFFFCSDFSQKHTPRIKHKRKKKKRDTKNWKRPRKNRGDGDNYQIRSEGRRGRRGNANKSLSQRNKLTILMNLTPRYFFEQDREA